MEAAEEEEEEEEEGRKTPGSRAQTFSFGVRTKEGAMQVRLHQKDFSAPSHCHVQNHVASLFFLLSGYLFPPPSVDVVCTFPEGEIETEEWERERAEMI